VILSVLVEQHSCQHCGTAELAASEQSLFSEIDTAADGAYIIAIWQSRRSARIAYRMLAHTLMLLARVSHGLRLIA
jgi:hypothetical protein